jgi:hypothetical protein
MRGTEGCISARVTSASVTSFRGGRTLRTRRHLSNKVIEKYAQFALRWEAITEPTDPPPGPPPLYPRPKQQNGLGGCGWICGIDRESAASHFWSISGLSLSLSLFLFFFFLFKVEGGE